MNMNLSPIGYLLIKSFEGLRLTAYRDQAGVWTIGYGSTRYHDGKAVKPGDKLANQAQADALFKNTLGQYEYEVNRDVKVPLTQNQFDALVSFTYNVGIGGLHGSTLLKVLNLGEYSAAAQHFLDWDKITVNGEKEVSEDLLARCKKEMHYFLTPEGGEIAKVA